MRLAASDGDAAPSDSETMAATIATNRTTGPHPGSEEETLGDRPGATKRTTTITEFGTPRGHPPVRAVAGDLFSGRRRDRRNIARDGFRAIVTGGSGRANGPCQPELPGRPGRLAGARIHR